MQVYTSTAVDHDNDQLLGALLVFTQVDWAGKGYKFFNRIMRHIEAKVRQGKQFRKKSSE